MALFVILAEPQNENENRALGEKIATLYPTNYSLTGGQWIISVDDKTTNDISEELELEGEKKPRVAVFRVASSSGWHKKSLWEWLSTKEGSS